MAESYHVEIAGMKFRVTTIHNYSKNLLQDYRIDSAAEHSIEVTQADIDHERVLAAETEESVDPRFLNFPDYYLESIAVLRKMADYICGHNRVLMHGSAIAIDGKGYIFTALSGTGKSTHTGLLRKLHGDNAIMINDDKPFIKISDDKIYVCGTPWMGKHEIGCNMTAPLEGIFFLRRSENNVLSRLSPEDALTLLLTQCHRPDDPEKLIYTLDILDQILTRVPLYDFGCNMDISAAELSSSVMK